MNDADAEILRQRARRLAARTDAAAPRELYARVAVVEAGGQTFGIPVEGLREIVALPAVTPLATGVGWLRGLAQVRGELLGVLDLAERVGQPGAAPRWLAVLLAPGGAFGVAVTGVRDFRDVYRDELADDLRPAAAPDRPIVAVTRDLVALLDVARLAGSDAADEPLSPNAERNP